MTTKKAGKKNHILQKNTDRISRIGKAVVRAGGRASERPRVVQGMILFALI
jgi:hypothetical protein